MEIYDRFVTLGGLRFHYREVGDPEGHPAVLLHALGSGCSDWDEVAQALAPEHRVLAFELRGSFASPRTERYSFELMRDDTRDLVDELGLDQFSLVGHSMGGTVAYLLAEEQLVEVARRIPSCRLIGLGGGHHVHTERRGEFVAAVLG